MAVIVNTSSTTTACSGPQDVQGKPLVMQGQPAAQVPKKSKSTKRVSFNFNDSQVYTVKSFRYEDDGFIKDQLWYSPMEHREMQLRINEMIEKLSYVNPTFAELMYGDTFRGLERILARRQGLLQDDQYDVDEHEFITAQSRDDDADEYHDAAICSRNTWRNSRTCRTVVASILWSNHYNIPKEQSHEEAQEPQRQESHRQFQIFPSMITNLLGDQHNDHQVKEEKNLLQQRVVRKYCLKSMVSASRAIDVAAEDKRFVDEAYSTTMMSTTSTVGSSGSQEEFPPNLQQTTSKSTEGSSLVEKLVHLQHVQQQQFAAVAC